MEDNQVPQAEEQKAVEMTQLTIDVPKGLSDFSNALADLLVAGKKALADGFQPGQDLPEFLAKAIADFGPMAANFSSVIPAFKEDTLSSVIVLVNAIDKALK